jgi:hypothetical protein
MIPIVGPILNAFGQVGQMNRVRQAAISAANFNSAVESGDLIPDHPAMKGIPEGIALAGLREAQKIRATPAYQGRQLFQEAMPSWQTPVQGPYEDEGPGSTYSPGRARDTSQRHAENFQAFAQQFPEVFGALGSPETGRIAMENIYTPTSLGRYAGRGMQTPAWYKPPGAQAAPAETAPQAPGEITQTPLQSSTPQGPGSPQLQADTDLAGKALKYQVKPQTALAFLGTEASPQTSISPKGAVSRWQIMPGTARPYLEKLSPEWTMRSNAEIQAALKTNDNLADHVGLSILADLERLYPGQPELQAAAYFSGSGNVKDGKIVDDTLSDGHLTVRQYVDRFMKNYNGQTSTPRQLASGQSADTSQMVAGPGAPTPQAQPQPPSIPDQIRRVPLGSFNPNGPRPITKRTDTMAGGKPGWSDEEMSLPEYAAGWLADQVDQNPMNYQAAYKELAQKRALPPPEQLKIIQAGTAAKLFAVHEQALANQGYKGAPLEIEALKRVMNDMGIGLTPEITNAMGNNPWRGETINFLREHGRLLAETSATGDVLRRKQSEEEIYKKGRVQRQAGEIRTDMPIEQLPDFSEFMKSHPGVDPKSSISQIGRDLGIPYDERFMTRSVSTENAYMAVKHLEHLFFITDPSTSPSFQALVDLGRRMKPDAWKVEPENYKDLREALPGILAAVAGESGGRYSDKNVENWMKLLPTDATDKETAGQRFHFIKQQILRPHLAEIDYRTSRKVPLQDVYDKERGRSGGGQMSPTQPPQSTWDPSSGKPRIPVPGSQ